MNYIGHGSIQVEKIGEITIGDFPMMVSGVQAFPISIFQVEIHKALLRTLESFRVPPDSWVFSFPHAMLKVGLRCGGWLRYAANYGGMDGWSKKTARNIIDFLSHKVRNIQLSPSHSLGKAR